MFGDPFRVLDLSAHAHLLVVGSRLRERAARIRRATVSAHGACPVVVCRPTTVDHAQTGVIVGAKRNARFATGRRVRVPPGIPLRDLLLTALHGLGGEQLEYCGKRLR